MIFGISLILIIGGLLVFCLTESKGRHSVHARQSKLKEQNKFSEIDAPLRRKSL